MEKKPEDAELASNLENDRLASGQHDAADKTGTAPEDDAKEWITGIRLWLIILAITMACFLMLLDLSIIVTVGGSPVAAAGGEGDVDADLCDRRSPESPVTSSRCPT